jgi:hypothetical protein
MPVLTFDGLRELRSRALVRWMPKAPLTTPASREREHFIRWTGPTTSLSHVWKQLHLRSYIFGGWRGRRVASTFTVM